MKKLFFLSLFFCFVRSFGQDHGVLGDDGKILIDNDKIEVIKFVGEPHGNVCGLGMHHHKAHLTVALDDAKVMIGTPDGKQQEVEIPAEAAIWFDAGTHSVTNLGNKETKFLLVYLK